MPRRTRSQIEKARKASDAAHARHILKTYGITADEYAAIKESQGGICAICERATGSTRRLAVDHSHEFGWVRGLLCKPCNRMLGHCRDDVDMLDRAISYLLLPPAEGVIGFRKVPDD